MRPHIFDHEPTPQEIFDQACVFFATSPGPSSKESEISSTNTCMYRDGSGRMCVAGYFMTNESYLPEMDEDNEGDGSDVKTIVKHYPDRVPAWFANNVDLLRGLQGLHDSENNWLPGLKWDYPELVGDLLLFAEIRDLKPDAIEQVRAHIPKPQWTEQDDELLAELQA
ncbi:hypothetical protein [Bradyrhizobium sp. SZCCHNR3118]|uniref:hypothetical protein n=1 Tax=Bradyrhizobium sp. SZCCHNR3118 TaxID=3057468 RepID=UPI0029163763|nr:hypothetical protein [Bradyrhizobium sp. SZCCHNR3118]